MAESFQRASGYPFQTVTVTAVTADSGNEELSSLSRSARLGVLTANLFSGAVITLKQSAILTLRVLCCRSLQHASV